MEYEGVLSYISAYWPRIIRTTRRQKETSIALPRQYLVPSDGAMFQEMYYWDTYFISLGFAADPEYAQVVVDAAENMAAIFRRFGVIPNASRYYFLSRSQPPLFTAMIRLAYGVKQRRGDSDAKQFLRRLVRVAEREHETVWLGAAQPHHRMVHAGLSRYFDINYLDALASCESGWDHSTRCDDRWLQHLPVDLNAILYMREMDFADLDALPAARREHWRERAGTRAATINRLMWDAEQGFFFDYDWVNLRRNPTPTLAGFYPLWTGLASQEQAARIVGDWLPRFSKPGGLVTSLDQRQGRQWASPNGWAPLQWIVAEGLDRYGFAAEARAVRRVWCDLCAMVLATTGVMWEKYNVLELTPHVEAGLYGSVPGFGWSNGVFVDFAAKLAAAPAGTSRPEGAPRAEAEVARIDIRDACSVLV